MDIPSQSSCHENALVNFRVPGSSQWPTIHFEGLIKINPAKNLCRMDLLVYHLLFGKKRDEDVRAIKRNDSNFDQFLSKTSRTRFSSSLPS